MAKFTLNLDAGGDVASTFVEALSGRQLLVKESSDRPHPFQHLSVTSKKLSSALSDFLDSLEKDEFPPSGDPHPLGPKEELEALAYRAAEVFELYEGLPTALAFPGSKAFRETAADYRSGVSKAGRDFKLLCNSLKHNSNSISTIQYTLANTRRVITAFRLLEATPGEKAMRLNENYHRKGERQRTCTTFLHQLIYGVLRCDYLAANAVAKLLDVKCEPISPSQLTLFNGRLLQRIVGREKIVFSSESTMFDGLELHPELICLRRLEAAVSPEPAEVVTKVLHNGYSLSYPYK